jgi:DNA end-binding protein Ku
MARALWKGALSFGLVSIPVELHTAVRDHRTKFRMLHAKDKSRVRFERVCIREDRPVPWSEIVKGYEYGKGRFVIVTEDDFRAAAVEKIRRVDIIDFVDAEEIDDRFFETPYYLVPEKSGAHAYALLREAMRDSGQTGIASFILRDTQHLAAVEVIGKAIVLTVMRFADELVDLAQFDFPAAKDLRKPELEMAKALVKSLAAEWDPGKYKDQYTENLMRIIRAKIKGREPKLQPTEEQRPAQVVNLMERLRKSLEQSGTKAGRARNRQKSGAKTAARSRKTRAA